MNFVPSLSLQTKCIHEITLPMNIWLIPTALGTSLDAEVEEKTKQNTCMSGGGVSQLPH